MAVGEVQNTVSRVWVELELLRLLVGDRIEVGGVGGLPNRSRTEIAGLIWEGVETGKPFAAPWSRIGEVFEELPVGVVTVPELEPKAERASLEPVRAACINSERRAKED